MPSGSWAAHWNVGDTVNAAEMNKGVGAIFDSTAGGAVASFDITSIVASYAHLRIYMQLRGDTVAVATNLNLRFNNSSASLYFDVRNSTTDASNTPAGDVAAQTLANAGFVTASSAASGYASVTVIDIPNYAGTTFNKQFSATTYHLGNTGTGNQTVAVNGGAWGSTAAINRITLFPGAGNFIAGSRCTVYALGS